MLTRLLRCFSRRSLGKTSKSKQSGGKQRSALNEFMRSTPVLNRFADGTLILGACSLMYNLCSKMHYCSPRAHTRVEEHAGAGGGLLCVCVCAQVT